MPSNPVNLLFRAGEELWTAFARRIRDTEGESIVILSTPDNTQLLQEEERRQFLEELAKIRYRVALASKEPAVLAAARKLGIRVYSKTRMLRWALRGHPASAEALRFFSRSLWRQHWRSRLQSIGLLSLPRMRIGALIGLSVLLFLFVIFRLMPSANIRVWPKKDIVVHTMNVILAVSGATVDLPSRTRTMPMLPITVRVRKSLVFKDISPEFIGSDAEAPVTITNKLKEDVTLKKGTRLVNQAGMIFRLQRGVAVKAGGQMTVQTKADHLDLYDKIIGERGNVPAGLEWIFPGLERDDQDLIKARNTEAAYGGRTAYRTVLQSKDLDLAQRRLERELLNDAKELMKQELTGRNASSKDHTLALLNKPDLIKTTYSGFILPLDQIGQQVESVTIMGSVLYTIPAYDTKEMLREFGGELRSHLGEGKSLLADSVRLDADRAVVFDFADSLAWIKMTVDVLGTQEFILDPLSPTGARFGNKVRGAIAGLPGTDAIRIVKNFPEVERAEIRIWPPWNSAIPSIHSNIFIDPQ